MTKHNIMRCKITFAFLFLITMFTACSSDSPEEGAPKDDPFKDIVPVTVTFDESTAYQTMDGVGANSYAYPYTNDLDWDWNNVKFVFNQLDIRYIRLASWFGLWEVTNDNDNPDVLDLDSPGFDPQGVIHNDDLGFAKFLAEKNIEVDLGIWGGPEWLVTANNPAIDPANYDELGETVAAYVKFMKNNGVDIAAVEVGNEPDIDAGAIYQDGEHVAEAAGKIIEQLDRQGLTDVKIHGPNLHSPVNTAEWGSYFTDNAPLNNRLAAISYHTWWSSDSPDYTTIKAFAAEHNKPVWATEMGYCALPEGCNFGGVMHYLKPGTWETAWDFAMSYYRAIKWSGASRVYHWTLLGHGSVVSETGQRYPTYFILKHFANYIPAGAVLIRDNTDDPGLLTLTFKLKGGSYSAIIINKSDNKKRVVIKPEQGDKTLTVTSVMNSRKNNYDKEPDVNANAQHPDIIVPAESVTSVKFE